MVVLSTAEQIYELEQKVRKLEEELGSALNQQAQTEEELDQLEREYIKMKVAYYGVSDDLHRIPGLVRNLFIK